MCGLAGVVIGPGPRSKRSLARITNLFTRLLIFSEHRGPLATGAAWLDASGRHRIYKAPLPASRFAMHSDYADWQASIPPSAVLLMGHTRWPTQGSHLDNRNNHPLVLRCADPILVTHNGNIPQVAKYFKHFGLPRCWGVDSELLVRLAHRHAEAKGINVPALLRDLDQCEGHIAAVMAWTAHPETIIFIRRDRPLFLARHTHRRLIAYASEHAILSEAIQDEKGWRIHRLSEGTALEMNTNTLEESITCG